MGNARARGTYEQRVGQALLSGRVQPVRPRVLPSTGRVAGFFEWLAPFIRPAIEPRSWAKRRARRKLAAAVGRIGDVISVDGVEGTWRIVEAKGNRVRLEPETGPATTTFNREMGEYWIRPVPKTATSQEQSNGPAR